jgi:hypothetical protein
MRLMRVIANLIHPRDHRTAIDLLLRLAAVALVMVAIFALLPAIVQGAG